MLDSLLAKTWLQQNHPELFSNKAGYSREEIFDFVNTDFPIKYNSEFNCFEASQIFLTGNIQSFITSEKKRWNEYQQWRLSDKEQSNIDVQRGNYKSANIPRDGYVATSAVAYFNGNVDKVLDLLQKTIGIGKKVNKGYGWIKDFEIRETNDNFFDKLLRPLALDKCKELNFTGQIKVLRTLPPYHQFVNSIPCLCPNFTL